VDVRRSVRLGAITEVRLQSDEDRKSKGSQSKGSKGKTNGKGRQRQGRSAQRSVLLPFSCGTRLSVQPAGLLLAVPTGARAADRGPAVEFVTTAKSSMLCITFCLFSGSLE